MPYRRTYTGADLKPSRRNVAFVQCSHGVAVTVQRKCVGKIEERKTKAEMASKR